MNFIVPARHLFAVSKAVAKKDVRYYICGLHIDPEHRSIVSTDGHVLCLGEYPEKEFYADTDQALTIGHINGAGEPFKLLRPTKMHQYAIITIDPETQVGSVCYWDKNIESAKEALKSGQVFCSSVTPIKIIDGKYPNYRQILPQYSSPISSPGIGFNSEYMMLAGEIGKIAMDVPYPLMVLHFPESDHNSMEITYGHDDKYGGMRFIIMPMEHDVDYKAVLPVDTTRRRKQA